MLDHVGFAVSDAEKSRRFYEAALAPLGMKLLMTVTPDQTEAGGTAHGFGTDANPFFWIGDNEQVGQGSHVAFVADSHDTVRAFYDGAISAGATDNGPPGPRPQYGTDYYAAFVLDLDGLNIEAVCRRGA